MTLLLSLLVFLLLLVVVVVILSLLLFLLLLLEEGGMKGATKGISKPSQANIPKYINNYVNITIILCVYV